MALPKPNGSGSLNKYDIALFSIHLAEPRPHQSERRKRFRPTRLTGRFSVRGNTSGLTTFTPGRQADAHSMILKEDEDGWYWKWTSLSGDPGDSLCVFRLAGRAADDDTRARRRSQIRHRPPGGCRTYFYFTNTSTTASCDA